LLQEEVAELLAADFEEALAVRAVAGAALVEVISLPTCILGHY
jgi:hypothetical protein